MLQYTVEMCDVVLVIVYGRIPLVQFELRHCMYSSSKHLQFSPTNLICNFHLFHTDPKLSASNTTTGFKSCSRPYDIMFFIMHFKFS